MTKRSKPSIIEVVHESAKGFYEAGLMNIETMRSFNKLCPKSSSEVEEYECNLYKAALKLEANSGLLKKMEEWDEAFINDGLINTGTYRRKLES